MQNQSLQALIDDQWGDSYLGATSSSVESADDLPTVSELAQVLEDMPIALFIDSTAEVCIYANRAYRSLSEVAPEEMGQEFWPRLADDATRDRLSYLRNRLWTTGQPFSAIAPVTTSAGSKKWLSTHTVPVVDANGKVLRAMGTIADATERVEAMQALERSEHQFRALVTNTADAIIGIDSDQQIQVWNETAVEMFGYEQSEILGESISKLIPLDMAAGHPELIRNFSEGPKQRVSMLGRSVQALRKDGTEFFVEVGIAKVRLGEEELSVATVRDVSDRERILTERQKSDSRFRALIQNSLDTVLVIGADHTFTYVSPGIERISGYKPEEVSGYDLSMVISPVHRDDRKNLDDVINRVEATKDGYEVTVYRQRHKDGTYRTLEARVTNFLEVDGLNSIVINIRDISETVAMEAEIKDRNDELTAILAAFPDQLYRVTRDGLVIESLADNDVGALKAARIVGCNLGEILPDRLAAKFIDAFRRVADSGVAETVEYTINDYELEGDDCFEARLSALPDGNILGSIRDISERVRMERLLTYQALHDGLTGLPNRQLLATELQDALQHTSPSDCQVGVLFLDLDGFKRINDGLGHAAGDELLVEVANRLREAVRPDDIVARIGGDEFIVMSGSLRNLDEAEFVAERIHSILEIPIRIAGTDMSISASIGIALSDIQGSDAEALIANADSAMYRAKDRGRARAEVFDEDMQDFLDRRIVLEAELRNALALNEVVVRFSPIVDATTGQISGAQATPYWEHVTHGEVACSEFMIVAEQAGLCRQLYDTVINQALAEAKTWKAATTTAPILSLSLSLTQVVDEKFRAAMISKLNEFGVAPKSLCLEITEASTPRASNEVIEGLKSLRELGIQIAIDNFGNGYSSLGALRSLPISCVNIHSGFIAGLEDGRADSAIVRSSIDLAHQFGLWVVAKGVDTPEQMLLLRSMGCDSMQGNLIAEPLMPEAFVDLLTKNRRW